MNWSKRQLYTSKNPAIACGV